MGNIKGNFEGCAQACATMKDEQDPHIEFRPLENGGEIFFASGRANRG